MTEFRSVSEDLALRSIAAAVAEGAFAAPEAAAGKIIDRLTASFGPVIQEIAAVIRSGAANLPAVLAALKAAGIALPSWATIVINILLALSQPVT